MRSPTHRRWARVLAVIAGPLALLAGTAAPAIAAPEPFLTPILPAQMEVGDRLPMRLVVCIDGTAPTTTAEEATAQEAERVIEEQRRNAEAEARDPRGRLGPESYDPIGFDEGGNPIWPTIRDPRDNPFRIEVRTPDPPGCSGVSGEWRLRSDNIGIETTSLYGDAVLNADAPGVGKFRVRTDIEGLPRDWLDFRVKVIKKQKKTPFEKLFGDAFKVDHVDLTPHETRAGTREEVIGVAFECTKKDKCRPATGKFELEHDGDGDIADGSVTTAGSFWRFVTGDRDEFDVGRIVHKAGREFFSLAVETAAREGRQQGDANGIAGGIDQDDVFWLWVRRGMSAEDEGWDDWMDLVPDGVLDMFDIALANARSVENGNGSFDAARFGYGPTQAPDEATEADVDPADPDGTTDDPGTQDPATVLRTIPAWKQLAVERERHE